MHLFRHRSLLVALVAAVPAVASAQEHAAPVQDSLSVRRGDTLWGLARDHLGSPYRWSDILALNVGVVADPHWIYPGQRLRLPGGAAPVDAVAVAEVVRDDDSEELPSSASLAFRETTPSPAGSVGRTVPAPVMVATAGWFSVPYVAAPGAPRGAGQIVDGVDVGPSSSRSATRRFQQYDRLVLTLPPDVAPTVGNAVMLVRRGPDLRDGQVLMPTGIAIIDGEQHGLATARLTRVFDVVQAGQAVVAVPPAPAATASTEGAPLETRIAWVAGGAELPTLGAVVLLSAGAREGVREGDRFDVVADGRRLGDGLAVPDTRAAVVRIVRVTEFGATARIITQDQPAVSAGMRVRRVTDTR